MKKVLALVLALTMVLGFAATASASYFGFNTIERELLTVNPVYTVGGENYTKDMDVEGNKEYTIKTTIDADNIVNYADTIDTIYDDLNQEYEILELISKYAEGNFYLSENWTAHKGGSNTDANDINGSGNELFDAAWAALGNTPPYGVSEIYTELVDAVAEEGNFRDGYKSNAFQSAVRDLERAWNATYGVNSFYGYDKGIMATATSKDSTYATVTSQLTIKFERDGGNTTCTVEFKVRFTNTTFRTADVDIEIEYLSGSVSDNLYYEHKDTLSFTVFQAAGCPRWRVAHGGGIENKRLAPAMRRGEESGGGDRL